MAVESWITPEETPALAEAAAATIEARLARLSPAERAAYWASIRKCYNTPYNDPVRRKAPAVLAIEAAPPRIVIAVTEAELPLPAAIPAAVVIAAEVQAA